MGLLNFDGAVGTALPGASPDTPAGPESLKRHAAALGVDVSAIDLKIEGGHVRLGGRALTREHAERITLAIGNTLGVNGVDSQINVLSETPASNFHTVLAGETLWTIAEKAYGAAPAGKPDLILAANRPPLDGPGDLYLGLVLRIPPP